MVRVQFCEELAGWCPDTITGDATYLEAVYGSPNEVVVDEDAMDNGSDGAGPVPIDASRQHLVEMCIPVLRPGVLYVLEYGFDHVIN